MNLIIPRQDQLIETGVGDPLRYYYQFGTSWFYRNRLAMVVSLLGTERYRTIVEIGYGSGILLPTLAQRCDRLYGLDLHQHAQRVQESMACQNVSATLASGDLMAMPYSDAMFDAIVVTSVLEHIGDLDRALREMKRVLVPGGVVVAGFPTKNRITDMLFAVLGFAADEDHVSPHQTILEALKRCGNVDKFSVFPAGLPIDYSLYVSARLRTA